MGEDPHLENDEWGSRSRSLGLIAVSRKSFERKPKPSRAWLGQVAPTNGAGLREALTR